MLAIQDHSCGISFKIRVQPKSSRNQIVGPHGDALKLRVTAPPVEGAANKACIELLSKALGVPRSCLEITSGQSGRSKNILIHCRSTAAAHIKRHLEKLFGI
jgi:uncharacterized protein (TIGR00251 family)